MEPAVHYLAGDGSPPCFLYSGTFLLGLYHRVEKDKRGSAQAVQLTVC